MGKLALRQSRIKSLEEEKMKNNKQNQTQNETQNENQYKTNDTKQNAKDCR